MEAGGGRDPPIRQLTAEEEAAKKSTDCVYFLASPLTCKKGSECEYRHSENARLNPRDCWFWLNGNCLNSKCGFRHPPLESLSGPTSRPAPPTPQAVVPSQTPSTHGPGHHLSKQSVPCYYFQKGTCLKGDWCQFMHGPSPVGNSASQYQKMLKVPPFLTDQTQAVKKDSFGLKKCTTASKEPKTISGLLVEVPRTSEIPITRPESIPDNDCGIKKSPSPAPEFLAPLPQIPDSNQGQQKDDSLQRGREADEFLAESSPGFDVLVDEDDEDAEFFHYGSEEYDVASGQDGRSLDALKELDYDCSEYIPRLDRDRNGDRIGDRAQYGHQLHMRDSWERSPGRISGRPSKRDRRGLSPHRVENTHEMDGSDLRHRLLKQRRLNGTEERSHASSRSSRGADLLPSEHLVSARLRGRITLPRRLSPEAPVYSRLERENIKGRSRGRSSPPKQPSIQRRHHHHDSSRRTRQDEDLLAGTWKSGSRATSVGGLASVDFAGPKSLAELKGAKVRHNSEDQLGNPQAAPRSGHRDSNGSRFSERSKRLAGDVGGGSVLSRTVQGGDRGSSEDGEMRYAVGTSAAEGEIFEMVGDTVAAGMEEDGDQRSENGDDDPRDWEEGAYGEADGGATSKACDEEYQEDDAEDDEGGGCYQEDGELDDEDDDFASKVAMVLS